MRVQIKSAVLGLGLCLGCGPQLRQTEKFTPDRVRQMTFDDECELQTFHDSRKAGLKAVGFFSVNDGGHAEFKLAEADASAFTRLAKRLYRRLPKLPAGQEASMKVPFQESHGHRGIPIGGKVSVKWGDEEFELPYHPCISAFFYGAEQYRMRRELNAAESDD